MLSWNTTSRNVLTLLAVCVLYATFSIVNAQFGAPSSRGVSSPTGRSPDPAVPHELTQQEFDRAAVYSDSENSQKPHLHNEHTAAHEATTVRDSYATLKSASETAQDVWNILKPSKFIPFKTNSRDKRDKPEAENDLGSVDEDLKHIRHIIQILSRTHNALLERKLTELPLYQRVWFKFFYSYGGPLLGHEKATQKIQDDIAQSSLANSARDYVSISGNADVIKENIDAVTSTFAKELSLSLSTLKDAAQNAAHGRWLATPDVNTYFDEITRNISALSEKWLGHVGNLADIAKPIALCVPLNEYVQEVLNNVEKMVTEFQDEAWRMRTEWAYKRGETLSWANESLCTMKKLGMHELDRLSEKVHNHVDGATHTLKAGMERNRAHVAYLQQHAAERMNHFIGLLVLWIDVSKALLRTVTKVFKSYVEKSWRIIAFVAVIVLFRFLLNFVHVDASVKSFVSNTFSKTVLANFPPRGSRPASERGPGTPQLESPTRSERSESKPITKEIASENEAARNVSDSSQVPGTVSPILDFTAMSTAQRQEGKTASKSENPESLRSSRPLRVSNFDYLTALSCPEQQKDGQPIRIGDHVVQLVYNNIPGDALPDEPKNDLGRKRRSSTTKVTGTRRISRRGEKQLASERVAQTNDDDNVSGGTSGVASAHSRQTRSSARRTSARRSHLR